MSPTLGYVVVTPVRNEAQNLHVLAGALLEQTVMPEQWIIVDNGSTDGTGAAAAELTAQHPWIASLDSGTGGALARGAPIVRAFHTALEQLSGKPNVVVKLDADITFEADHFERLLAAFAASPTLGIAGGSCFERDRDGVWRQRHGTGAGVWGANRAYRMTCLQTILPLEERMGWDTLDLVKAEVNGWEARVIEGVHFLHHRPEGAREGSRASAWAVQGDAAHYMGYRFSYLLVRTLYRMLKEPQAIALLWGYLGASIRREQRCADAAVRAYVRRAQSWRQLPRRIREARRPRTLLDHRGG